MNTDHQKISGNSQKLHIINVLEQLSDSKVTGCLRVGYESVSYLILFSQGKLIYATHSIEPFERLGRYLKAFSKEIPRLTNEICNQVQLRFEAEILETQPPPDYQAICWLVEERYIQPHQVANLLEKLTKEVFESYLLLPEVYYQDFSQTIDIPVYWQADLRDFIEICRHKLQSWQALNTHIKSPFQRPYFFVNSYAQKKLSSEQQKKLGSFLKGFNFRQLAVLLDQDELILAQRLYPLIVNGSVILREPQPPFDQLPKLNNQTLNLIDRGNNLSGSFGSYQNYLEDNSNSLANYISSEGQLSIISTENDHYLSKEYTIICVDDSPTVLQEINRFLDNKNINVIPISDSLKALRSILRIQPDLILLDLGMPEIDGYKLCSMLRKHPLFQTTPIIMVTGKTGIINRAKAKFVGATDYITKPFTQVELLKIVFKYLT
jgi:two-component system, chemotaxis family, response regulator PixG